MSTDSLPNHLHYDHDIVQYSCRFGNFYSAHVVSDGRAGHTPPYIKAWFTFGLRLDLTPGDAARLAHELLEQLAARPEPGGRQ